MNLHHLTQLINDEIWLNEEWAGTVDSAASLADEIIELAGLELAEDLRPEIAQRTIFACLTVVFIAASLTDISIERLLLIISRFSSEYFEDEDIEESEEISSTIQAAMKPIPANRGGKN